MGRFRSYYLTRAQAGLAKFSDFVRDLLTIVSCGASFSLFCTFYRKRVFHAYGCIYFLSLFVCGNDYVIYRLTSIEAVYFMSIMLDQIIKYYCRGAYVTFVMAYYGKGYECERRYIVGSSVSVVYHRCTYYYFYGCVALGATIVTSNCYLVATLYFCPIHGSLYYLTGCVGVRAINSNSGCSTGSNYSRFRHCYRAVFSLFVVSFSFKWFQVGVHVLRVYYRPTFMFFLVRFSRSYLVF